MHRRNKLMQKFSRSCYAKLSSCSTDSFRRQLLDDPHACLCDNYFVFVGICTSLRVFLVIQLFLWISSNSCPLNLLLVRSHQVEAIIVKRLIQEPNNVTSRARVEPRLCRNHSRRNNDAFAPLGHAANFLGE